MVAQDGKVFLLFAGEYKEANENNVRAWGDQGILLAADTLEELADKMQVSYANLQATLDEYNEAVKQGTDARFGRARLPLTHEQPAYYALEIHAAAYTTLGGVKIDTNAQVLRSGQPIPGLYAAGEVAGGLFGTNKPGVTTATQNIVFGRLAADSAVKSLK
jgi:succinate dehydrogenase/fumarate reductase flavoprotein subunit